MPTFPVSSGTTITTASFNDIYDILYEVIGIGEDGWGIQDFFSSPASLNTRISARGWQNLRIDLVETAYQHITNSTSTWTTSISTGSVITTSSHNQAWEVAQYVYANRHECAEEQYFRDPITEVSTNTTGGSSSRTIVWNNNTQTSITHVVRARWANRLLARYFFNSGGYWTWTPYQGYNILNDLDLGWANFIYEIQTDQQTNPLKYDRAAFVAQSPGTTATIYPVGSSRSYPDTTYEYDTLSVNVEVFKSSNEQYLEFTITFANSDAPTLVITPSVGYWNEVI